MPKDRKPSLSVEERKDKLMTTLDLSGLNQWPEEKAGWVHELLMEYHDIFSLDNNELGCASQVKHSIKVTDDEPFKERFQRIPPPLLEEVRMHVNDMLQAGAIRPSSSPWCNAVGLVRKKGWWPPLLYRFQKVECEDKERQLPSPSNPGNVGELGGVSHIL